MNTKEFNSTLAGSTNKLTVAEAGHEISFTIDGSVHARAELSSKDILVPASDAPAIALAILSAAGIVHHDPDDTPFDPAERTENMGPLNMAAFYLARHVSQAEKAAHIAAKEAADRETLFAEAKTLFKARHGAPGALDWEDCQQGEWLNVARAARELHGGTK